MLLSLIRINESPTETTGILLCGGKPFCGTLEPPVVPNATHPKGAIPLGWYKLTLTKSPKFGRVLPLLHYVPGFEGSASMPATMPSIHPVASLSDN